MKHLTFAQSAWDDYIFWQLNDKKTLRKINELLKDIQRTPFDGIGLPEPLKGSKSWSRRINNADRLVYEVSNDAIIILQCKGHYDDK